MNSFNFTGRRALVADDIPVNLEIAKWNLEQVGFKVDCAPDGKAALDMFTSSRSGTYSIIIMDIRMPVMDGYDAARHIRASSHPDAAVIPIMALSADATPYDAQKTLDCGMNAHVSKPLIVETFQDTLYRLICEYESR